MRNLAVVLAGFVLLGVLWAAPASQPPAPTGPRAASVSTASSTRHMATAVASRAATSQSAARCTFSWSMESETPEVTPAGASSRPYYYPVQPTMRTDTQAHSGKYSLDLSTQSWRQATFDNPTNEDQWASTRQGAIVLWWKYTGELNAGMLMQLTGKSKDKKLDTNDGLGIRFHGKTQLRFGYGWDNSRQSTSIRYEHGKPFEADRWYKVTAKWNADSEPHLYLRVDDGKPATGGEAMGATACKAWHHLLWGNDTNTRPPGLYLDDVQVWDGWEIPEK